MGHRSWHQLCIAIERQEGQWHQIMMMQYLTYILDKRVYQCIRVYCWPFIHVLVYYGRYIYIYIYHAINWKMILITLCQTSAVVMHACNLQLHNILEPDIFRDGFMHERQKFVRFTLALFVRIITFELINLITYLKHSLYCSLDGKVFIHSVDGYLTPRSREVWKPWDSGLDFPNHSANWHATP